MYKERSKNEEEEKHEKESTKEKKGKRDLSAPPSGSHKRQQVMASQEGRLLRLTALAGT